MSLKAMSVDSLLRRNGACKDRIFGFLKCLFVSQSFYLNGGRGIHEKTVFRHVTMLFTI